MRLVLRYMDGTTYRLGVRTTNREGRFRFTDVVFDATGHVLAKVRATSRCRAAASNEIFIGGT